ncbi:MAG: calcium/sodium antiporter [Gammaproteobacteria bacterium]|nr:calcium/sodium antiporter [Gammaproteobacteria bacterium]
MLVILAGLIIGLAILVWSADRFVDGSIALSHHFRIPPIVIGIVIIGFGTSAPELFISGMAAVDGNGGLALGNALGSNIANTLLILGVTAIITPLVVLKRTVSFDFPVLLLATIVLWLVLKDGQLDHTDGILLLVVLIIALAALSYVAMRTASLSALEIPAYTQAKAIAWTLFSLFCLLVGSKILVISAVDMAEYFNIPDLVIGLSIIAIGTSLPELAASVNAARKGHSELAIGNVVGSNLFNSMAVVGIPAILQTYPVADEVLYRDYPAVLLSTLVLFLMSLFALRSRGIYRVGGVILLLGFIAFQTLLYIETSGT